ncbi:uncharacterized protein LOC143239505 isoform X2 [Tachypleus tridentatus]|uniref:uncharacterized protein LOC143239505 isoform X2 n=1 Tax=Tachypleus tridentatus TaxID=6853 RepID=UPI003FD58E7F
MEGSDILPDESSKVIPKFSTEKNTTIPTSAGSENTQSNLAGINDSESNMKSATESEITLPEARKDEDMPEKNRETKNRSVLDEPVLFSNDKSHLKLPPNVQRCEECDNRYSINDQNDVTSGVHKVKDTDHPNDNQVLVHEVNQNYCSTSVVCESCGKETPILEFYKTDAGNGGRLSRGALKRVSVTSSFRKDKENIVEKIDNGEIMEEQPLTFIDFVPEKLKHTKGEASSLSYENFRSLVGRANQWLHEKSHFCVVNCETVLFKISSPEVDPNIMVYADNPQYPLWGVRGLRLWISPAKKDSPQTPWNIYYVNLLPQKIGETDVGSQQRHFAPLSKVVDNFNHLVKSGNIEGVEDFFKSTETFSCLVSEVSSCFAGREFLRICNIQSVYINLRNDKYGDSQQMCYLEQHNSERHFARFLRVFYVKQNSPKQKTNHFTKRLTCKTIVPTQYGSNINIPPHDDADKIKEMISSWLKLSGAVVISASTDIVQLSLYGVGSDKTELNRLNVKPKKTCCYMYIIRLYLDGQYEDQLPRASNVKSSECCILL